MNLADKTKEELIAELQNLQRDYAALKDKYEQDIVYQAYTEQQLHKEQDFSKKLIESLPSIFYLYTYPELHLVLWNKNHETLLGFTSGEIANRHIMDWYIPEAKPLVQEAVDTVMTRGLNVLELPLLNKQGEYIPFLMTGVRFETENQAYLMGVGIDISERKRMEQILQERENLFRLLAENSTDMIAKHDEAGNFIYVSPACKTLLGYEPEELLGHSAFEYIHPDDARAIEQSRQHIIVYPEFTTMVFRIQRKNGEYIWFETISRAIFDEQTGAVRELHASSRDVTARKLAEDARASQERRWATLFNSLTEMVALHELVFDDAGNAINYRIIDCNPTYTAITGIKREDAVGRLATEVYKSEQPPYFEEFSKVALTGQAFEYTTFYAPMDKHFMISVVSPEKNTFATITTDFTAIQQIQDSITEKNKELENYLYVASHDLRTPLVNIQGFSQRLQKHIDQIKTQVENCSIDSDSKSTITKIINDDVPRTLGFVFSNVSKMDTLINGLLQISRTGRIKMTIRQIDMNQLIRNITSSLNYQLSEIAAQLTIDPLPDCFGDTAQLNQLFSNIIENAIKYRDPKREFRLHISGTVRYNKAVCRVSDNGIGIAQRHLKRIWDVFYRVDASAAEAGEGLGLSIAKRIADKHKGKIGVESEENIGSTFIVELQNKLFDE